MKSVLLPYVSHQFECVHVMWLLYLGACDSVCHFVGIWCYFHSHYHMVIVATCMAVNSLHDCLLYLSPELSQIHGKPVGAAKLISRKKLQAPTSE